MIKFNASKENLYNFILIFEWFSDAVQCLLLKTGSLYNAIPGFWLA